ncbi:MAG: SIMPL domain-containing protein [Oscillospiraceae bacterium]|jgi:uncharacterized protein YggE|nr:SIMPL domain-containing protein [Oscillospiraceae bacterium]
MTKTAKTSIAAFAILAGIALGLLLIRAPGGKEAQAQAAENSASGTRVIEVTGNGSVKATPDIAVLNLGVTTTGATTAIQSENTAIMDRVLAAVKALGVDEKDIKTDGYYMNPNYDYANGKGDKIIGYTVYNTIEVKVRNISKAGEVLAAANAAGANTNNGVSFRLSDVETYYNQALEKAISNAKGKASTIAKALGVSVELPVRVSENGSYYTPIAYGNYDAVTENSQSVTISQGELEVTASVSVSYAY